MDYIEAPLDIKAAALNALASDGAALPDLIREKIVETLLPGSPVQFIVAAMEGLYAARADLPPVWLTLGANAAFAVETHGFNGKRARAATLHQIFRRCLGERAGPAAEKDPEVDAAFAPPASEPAPADGPVTAPEPVQ